MLEQREQTREPISVPVLCEPVEGDSFGGMMTDIGLGGSRIVCASAPAHGTALTVAARLPGSSELSHLPAIVRWASGDAFGVQFGLLTVRDTRVIAALVGSALGMH